MKTIQYRLTCIRVGKSLEDTIERLVRTHVLEPDEVDRFRELHDLVGKNLEPSPRILEAIYLTSGFELVSVIGGSDSMDRLYYFKREANYDF